MEEGGGKLGSTGQRGRVPHFVSVFLKARRPLRNWAGIWGVAGQHHSSLGSPKIAQTETAGPWGVEDAEGGRGGAVGS